jgi:hypothetical protein
MWSASITVERRWAMTIRVQEDHGRLHLGEIGWLEPPRARRQTVLARHPHHALGAHPVARHPARLAQLRQLGVVTEAPKRHGEASGPALHRFHLLDEGDARAGQDHDGGRSCGGAPTRSSL